MKSKITEPFLRRLDELWAQKLSGREISEILEQEGRFFTPERLLNLIGSTYRKRYPPKTSEERRAAQSRGLRHRAATLGWDQNPNRKPRDTSKDTWTPELTAKAAELWAQGLMAFEIAELLSTPEKPLVDRQVFSVATRLRDLFPYRRKKGCINPPKAH